jgi:hypothetical protein
MKKIASDPIRAGHLGGLAGLFIVGAIIGAPAFGGPIFFKNFVPDFYQHQKSGPDTNVPLERDVKFGYTGPAPAAVPSYDTTPEFWEQGGGWCCVAAFVNSFYFLEKNYGITGLFTRPDKEAEFEKAKGRLPTWQEEMIFAIEDLAKDMGLDGMTPIAVDDRIPKHVRKLQAAAKFPVGFDKLTYSEFDVTVGGTGTRTVTRQDANAAGSLIPGPAVTDSVFDLYRTELCHSEDVTIRIEYPEARRQAAIDDIRTKESAEQTRLGRDLTDAEFDKIVRDVLGPDLPWWFFSFHVMIT